MAQPKFRQIDYGLYRAMVRADMPSSVLKIVLVVFNYTHGYQRLAAPIPLSTFTEWTGLSRQGVIDAIHWAEQHGVLTVCRQGYGPKAVNNYILNDTDKWLVK